MHSMNTSINISQLNDDIADDRFINTVILSILLIIGVTGNFIVLFVYTFMMKKSEDRFFIPFLSVIDMLATISGTSFGIVQNLYSVMFPSLSLCRAAFFMTWTFSTASATLLLVIAVHRYVKVCKPHSNHMDLKRKKISLVSALVFAVAIGSPVLFIFKDINMITFYKGSYFTTRICEFEPTNNSPASIGRIYFGTIFFFSLTNIIVTVSLYVPVGRAIYVRFRSMKRSKIQRQDEALEEDIPNDPESSNVEISQTDTSTSKLDNRSTNITLTACGQNNYQNKSQRTSHIVNNDISRPPLVTTLSSTSAVKRRKIHRKRVRNNFTFMFMTIVIIYVISYVPTLILIAVPGSNRTNFWTTLPKPTLNVLLILKRMFLFNHVVNPFIYGFFDLTFREKFKTLCLNFSK